MIQTNLFTTFSKRNYNEIKAHIIKTTIMSKVNMMRQSFTHDVVFQKGKSKNSAAIKQFLKILFTSMTVSKKMNWLWICRIMPQDD